MALSDSFLLDSHPLHVHIAYRTDGVRGSGTQSDPYNGSTQALFDSIVSNLPTDKPVRVHLGPSSAEKPFQTAGFFLGSGGQPVDGVWRLSPHMSIHGSGIDVTFLQLVNDSAASNTHRFAIGSATTTCLDFLEICGMTIDCNLPDDRPIACGGIRVMGNHVRIHDLKCVGWGSRTTLQPGFVIALIITDPDENSPWPTADNCGIENCIAVRPSENVSSESTMYAFYIGGRERPDSGTFSFGRAPFIRNCFVDGAFADGEANFDKDIRAITVVGCHGGGVERNHVQNVKVSVCQDKVNFRDLTVRNNVFQNVLKGVWCMDVVYTQNLLPPDAVAPLTVPDSADIGLIEIPSQLLGYVAAGNDAWLSASETEYNNKRWHFWDVGIYGFPQMVFDVPFGSPPASVGAIKKVMGFQNLSVEGNTFGLADYFNALGVLVNDSGLIVITPPATAPIIYSQHGVVVVRNNRFRMFGDAVEPGEVSAVQVKGAKSLLMVDNVIDTVPSYDNALKGIDCNAVNHSGNVTFDGELLNPTVDVRLQTLDLPADDVMATACFAK